MAKKKNEEEQYLSYTINCEKFVVIIRDKAKVRIMSGQPSSPPPKPPGH